MQTKNGPKQVSSEEMIAEFIIKRNGRITQNAMRWPRDAKYEKKQAANDVKILNSTMEENGVVSEASQNQQIVIILSDSNI